MRWNMLAAFLLGSSVVVVSFPAAAQNCNSAPNSWGGAGAANYKRWCEGCCGSFSMSGGRPNCNPGGNWGCRGSGGGQPAYDNSAAIAAAEAERQRQAEIERQRQEAERQRQQEIEDQRRRDEEAARQRQLEFDRKKQEALSSMKGIAEGELGLKNTGLSDSGLKGLGDTGGSYGLKDNLNSPAPVAAKKGCQWGDLGSSVVDFRCMGLDPNKPIVLDPHVVRAQERVFPAQVDPATFQNANYNKGFAALMRLTFSVKDAADAVAYFKAAQLERPHDAMVRNGLLLAQDILKGRQQKQQEDQAKAIQSLDHGVAALMAGDVKTANDSLERAQKLDPHNSTIAPWSSLISGLSEYYKEAPGRNRDAVELVGHALVFESRGEFKSEILALEKAASAHPHDLYVENMLWRARHLDPKNPDYSSVAPGAVTKYPSGAGGLKPDDSR